MDVHKNGHADGSSDGLSEGNKYGQDPQSKGQNDRPRIIIPQQPGKAVSQQDGASTQPPGQDSRSIGQIDKQTKGLVILPVKVYCLISF